jgi:hypothetical protein
MPFFSKSGAERIQPLDSGVGYGGDIAGNQAKAMYQRGSRQQAAVGE